MLPRASETLEIDRRAGQRDRDARRERVVDESRQVVERLGLAFGDRQHPEHGVARLLDALDQRLLVVGHFARLPPGLVGDHRAHDVGQARPCPVGPLVEVAPEPRSCGDVLGDRVRPLVERLRHPSSLLERGSRAQPGHELEFYLLLTHRERRSDPGVGEERAEPAGFGERATFGRYDLAVLLLEHDPGGRSLERGEARPPLVAALSNAFCSSASRRCSAGLSSAAPAGTNVVTTETSTASPPRKHSVSLRPTGSSKQPTSSSTPRALARR
jgi:hypothetical protein